MELRPVYSAEILETQDEVTSSSSSLQVNARSLQEVLTALQTQAQQDPSFAGRDYYIRSYLGGHQSLIRATFGAAPEFLIMNLDRGFRPAPDAEKAILKQFGACADWYFRNKEDRQIKREISISGEHHDFATFTVRKAIQVLSNQPRLQEQEIAAAMEAGTPKYANTWAGLFKHHDDAAEVQELSKDAEIKPSPQKGKAG